MASVASQMVTSFPRTLITILGLAVMGVTVWNAAMYTAPAVISDWQVRSVAKPFPAVTVDMGECAPSAILFQSCTVTLTAPGPAGARTTRKVNYSFLFWQGDSRKMRAVVDPANPQWVTTDWGLSYLVNRTISLLLFVLVVVVLPVGSIITDAVRQSRAVRLRRVVERAPSNYRATRR